MQPTSAMDDNAANRSHDDDAGRQRAVQHVLAECWQRLAAGEQVDASAVLGAHPLLVPELDEGLQHLRLVQLAQAQSEQDHSLPISADADNGNRFDTLAQPRDREGHDALSSSLTIRCPHCHNPMPMELEDSLSSIRCSSCDNQFSLLNDEAEQIAPGDRLAHFELVRVLGAGGFGVVYLAHDTELDRLAALKIRRRGGLSAEEGEQFLREARAAAQLRHPNIVGVFEVGRDDRRLYIASEYVAGPSLADLTAEQPMTAREAATCCEKLARALSHAHNAGIVHRDLKPGNVIMDAQGEPHITDFGLARRDQGEVTMTRKGVVVGTPAYMSPEQARGQSHQVDGRSDVYSLGVILFELLTGELPFRGSAPTLTEQILRDEPSSPGKLNTTVPRDVETICLKCLEKEPRRRYETAQALADDLSRFLRGEPIVARPVGRLERSWRWCKRKPALAALVLVLAVVAVGAPLVAFQQRASRREAQLQARASRWQQYLSDMHAAVKGWEDGDVGRVVKILDQNRPARGTEDLRRFEWYHLWRQCQPSLEAPTFRHPDGVWALALTSDGSKLLVGTRSSGPDVLTIWDVARRTKLHVLSERTIWVKGIAVSPDDSRFATVGVDQKVLVWDLMTGSLLHEIKGHGGYTSGVAYSPDGSLIASSSADRTVKLWNAQTAELAHSFENPDATFAGDVAFSPDGQTLAAGAADGSIKLWNVPSRALIRDLRGHTGTVQSVSFSRDGKLLASGGADRTVRLWNTADGTLRGSGFVGHREPISKVDISPDGTTVASAGGRDGTIRVWDVAAGTEQRVMRGHSGGVWAVRYCNNHTLVSGGANGLVKLWDLDRKYDVIVLRGDGGQSWSAAVSRDGKSVIAGGGDGIARVWDLDTGQLLKTHTTKMGDQNIELALSPDGRRVAIGGQNFGRIEVWDLVTDEVVLLRDSGSLITTLAWSGDGRLLVSGESDEHNVIVWDAVTGKERLRLPGHREWVCSVAFSPDDRTLVTRCEDNTLRIWDRSTWTLRKSLDIPASFFSPVAFSPDGTRLACAGGDNVIQIRETTQWQIIQSAAGHTDHVKGLAFSPDGRTLASASDDSTIRLWEVATGEERCILRGHLGEVEGVKFTPDGRTLVSCGQDGTVRLWRTADTSEGP